MSKTSKLKHFHVRDFLEPPESHVDSFIHGDVSVERYEWKKGKKTTTETHLNAELRLGACSERIHWCWSASDSQDLTRMRAKASKTRLLLTQFFDELDIAFKLLEEELEKSS